MAEEEVKMTTVDVGGVTYRVREDEADDFKQRMGETESKAKTTAKNKAATAESTK